jgi:glycosyltransferase involved in cell wall biosynthesis
MNKSKNRITVIVPVYNEASVIRKVVEELSTLNLDEIVIVDDGSSDNVRAALKDLPVTYIRHKINLGQGAALQTGLNYAKSGDTDIIITFDGDGQHDVKDIDNLMKPVVEGNADVVLGSRFLNKDLNRPGSRRKIVLQIARFVNFIYCGYFLTDAHNGLRAMSRKAIDKIEISENRMAHASEILAEIRKHGLRLEEAPVNILYNEYTRKKGQSGINGIKIFFDLVLHKFFK